MHLESFLPSAILLGLLTLLVIIFLYEWIYRFSERTAQDVIPYLRTINFEEIKTLLDPGTEKYLRLNSSLQEFKRLQWNRSHLALQYVGDLAHNAKVFQEWGKFERTRSRTTLDRETRRTSLELTIACAMPHLRPCSANSNPFVAGQDGNLAFWRTSHFRVTSQGGQRRDAVLL